MTPVPWLNTNVWMQFGQLMGSVPNIKEAREITNKLYSGEPKKVAPSKKRRQPSLPDPFNVQELPVQFLTDKLQNKSWSLVK